MELCQICKKYINGNNSFVVDYSQIVAATKKGYMPKYYLEKSKAGIEFGLPKERKWINIVDSYEEETMLLCEECYNEMLVAYNSKKSLTRQYYCFIATSTYESVHAPEVVLLRQYRDRVLLKTFAGRVFVELYYLLSPPLAKIVAKSDKLKQLLRNYIFPPILKRVSNYRLAD